jgi:hypothetical protein
MYLRRRITYLILAVELQILLRFQRIGVRLFRGRFDAFCNI